MPQRPGHVCGKTFPLTRLHPWLSIRPGLSALIKAARPHWSDGRVICQTDLARFRSQYLERTLEDERGELTTLDKTVDSLDAGTLLSRQLGPCLDDRLTFGERMADRVARFGGSWPFVLILLAMLSTWIGMNIATLR